MSIPREDQKNYFDNGYPAPLSLSPEDAEPTEILVSIHDILSEVERRRFDPIEAFLEELPGPFFVVYNGSHHAWDFSLCYFTEGEKYVASYEEIGGYKMEDKVHLFVEDAIIRLLYDRGGLNMHISVTSDKLAIARDKENAQEIEINNIYDFIEENLEKAVKAWASSREAY